MKRLFALPVIAALCMFVACQKPTTRLTYNETYCADAWGGSSQAYDDKVEAVKAYLETKGVQASDIEVQAFEMGQGCLACACLSGNRIKISVAEEDVDAAIELGFYK